MTQRDEALELVEALGRNLVQLDARLDDITKASGAGVGIGQASINVNAGGVGVWLAWTACLMTLAATIIGAVFASSAMSEHSRRIDRVQDHLTAIYMMAPHLKPKEAHVQHDHYHHQAAAESDPRTE